GRAAMPDDAARGNAAAHRKHPAVTAEKDKVQVEAHAEGVDTGAPRDQQAGTGASPIEATEPKQAASRSGGDGDAEPADPDARQRPQARGGAGFSPSPSMLGGAAAPPPRRRAVDRAAPHSALVDLPGAVERSPEPVLLARQIGSVEILPGAPDPAGVR